MAKPWLILINGLPGTGKTTLARRLAADVQLPVLHRDGIYETLFDGLECQTYGCPPLIGPASFRILHYAAGSFLAAGHSLIIEGFFGMTELATAEFRQLQQAYDFMPLQIQCQAAGPILLERFLARAGTPERHPCHRDLEFVRQNREIMLRGRLANLPLGGKVLEVDTTDVGAYNYKHILQEVRLTLGTV
ncbi:ATP-binding protein [Ktedonosporobacter rubrisoli]|uniref:ATP-binding protein n=1 Tax=Ktedonosporobacter rubrisoli TaxID=2509675 RepID=A0A4P6JW06_KTERU|nr:AAA family ATPase [Ktedonosporobacter rubrisoli]QBD79857.1 ATP-binding protein [Ktedonosporobacter rubrisoli]